MQIQNQGSPAFAPRGANEDLYFFDPLEMQVRDVFQWDRDLFPGISYFLKSRHAENPAIIVLNVFHCPHGPDSTCDCRKPKPGMFLKAKAKHNTDMEKSWMIGDKERDIIAANRAGIHNTILLKSSHKIDKSKASFFLDSIQRAKQIITV